MRALGFRSVVFWMALWMASGALAQSDAGIESGEADADGADADADADADAAPEAPAHETPEPERESEPEPEADPWAEEEARVAEQPPEDDPWAEEAARVGEGSEGDGLSLEELLSVEIVESASRRQQSIHDAPSAVTLVPRDVIQTMGVVEVAELMRRVPGALVLRTAANSYRVVLRDIGTLVSNRVPILLDGRPVFDGITNLTPFQWMPVNVMDLDRVEAIRGPGSTLYGANAQGGVISLRTRRPLDALGFTGRLSGGLAVLPADDGAPAAMNGVGFGSLAYGVANQARTFGARASFGYGVTPEWFRPEGSEPFRRGQYGYNGRLTLQYLPNENTELLVFGTQADKEIHSLTTGDPSSSVFRLREQSWSVRGRVSNIANALDLRVAYDSTFLRFDTNAFGDAAQWQHGVRLQSDLRLFDDRSRTTVGVEFARLNVTELQRVTPERNNYSLVLQEEVSVIPDTILVSVAARFDLARYNDGDGIVIKYRNGNPRGSIIWRPRPGHDLRLTGATGFRVPNPIEVSSGVSRPPPDPSDPAIPFVVPNPQLRPERVRTIELGYRGDPIENLRTELVFFLQETKNTVLVTSAESLPLIYRNTETVNQIGIEADLRYSPLPRFSAYGHYRYLRSEGEDSGSRNIWPRHIGSVGVDGDLGAGFKLHADFSFVVQIATQELGALEGTPIITSGFVNSPNIYDANLALSKSVLEDRLRIFGSVRNIAGFFRDRDGLYQGLTGFSSPIGATILVGLELEPTGG